MNEFENVIKNIRNLMQDQSVSLMLGGKREMVNKTVEFLIDNISSLKNESNVYISGGDRASILETCRFINDVFLDSPINNTFLQFMQLFSLLIHNWNENLAHDADVNRYSRNLDRLGRYHVSSLEVLDMIKMANKKLRDQVAYGLPSSELSRHYLESIDEKMRVESEVNNAGDSAVCG